MSTLAQALVIQTGFNRFSDAVDTVALGSPVTIGNLLVVTIGLRSDSTAQTISSVVMTGGLSLTAVASLEHSDAGVHCLAAVYAGIATGTGQTATVTLGANWASTTQCLTIYEFAGSAASSPLDDTSTAEDDATDTTYASGAVDTTIANGVLVGLTYSNDVGTFTVDAAFTGNGDDSGFGIGGYRLVTTTGSYSMTNTGDDVFNAVTVLAAFKGAGVAASRTDGGILIAPAVNFS